VDHGSAVSGGVATQGRTRLRLVQAAVAGFGLVREVVVERAAADGGLVADRSVLTPAKLCSARSRRPGRMTAVRVAACDRFAYDEGSYVRHACM
jgi:hypothetical protein